MCASMSSHKWIVVHRSVFNFNQAGEAAGAVGLVSTSTVAGTFTDCDFTSNWVVGVVGETDFNWLTDLWGGGALVLFRGAAGTLVDRCNFTANHVAASITATSACMASLSKTAGKGGALLADAATVNVTRSTFDRNFACDGGAM